MFLKVFKRLLNGLFYRLHTLPRRVLCAIFGIKGGFHLTGKNKKKYVSCVIKHLNERKNRGFVLEIGCGLGDILRNLDFRKKFGFDKNRNILNALTFLDKFNLKADITTQEFVLGDKLDGKFDVIILCNWIHNIEPEFLKKTLQSFFKNNLYQGGEILIDVIISESDAYKFKHNASFLKMPFSEVKQIGSFPNDNMSHLGTREIYSFKKL